MDLRLFLLNYNKENINKKPNMKISKLFKTYEKESDVSCERTPEQWYEQLASGKYLSYPFNSTDLGEGMAVIEEVIMQYWKPRFLVDHKEKRAYEFMNCNEYLQTVGSDDILWSSLTSVSEEALSRARRLFAHYPTFIRKFQNGVAEVSWQINPDGQYFMDEDGFGMTDDKEIEIYGFIDRRGKVLVKFQMIKTSDDLKRMRKEAEELIL